MIQRRTLSPVPEDTISNLMLDNSQRDSTTGKVINNKNQSSAEESMDFEAICEQDLPVLTEMSEAITFTQGVENITMMDTALTTRTWEITKGNIDNNTTPVLNRSESNKIDDPFNSFQAEKTTE